MRRKRILVLPITQLRFQRETGRNLQANTKPYAFFTVGAGSATLESRPQFQRRPRAITSDVRESCDIGSTVGRSDATTPGMTVKQSSPIATAKQLTLHCKRRPRRATKFSLVPVPAQPPRCHRPRGSPPDPVRVFAPTRPGRRRRRPGTRGRRRRGRLRFSWGVPPGTDLSGGPIVPQSIAPRMAALVGPGPIHRPRPRSPHGGPRRRWNHLLIGAGSRFDHLWGRDFAARVGNQGERILAEVLRRIGDHDLEAVKEGIEDALAGRRSKW